MNDQIYSENYKTTIVRYDYYPSIEPSGIAVGLISQNKNNNYKQYFDTVMANELIINKTPTEVADMAFERLKNIIFMWAEKVLNLPDIIGEQIVINGRINQY